MKVRLGDYFVAQFGIRRGDDGFRLQQRFEFLQAGKVFALAPVVAVIRADVLTGVAAA